MRGQNRRLGLGAGSGNGSLTGKYLRRGLVLLLAVAAALAVIVASGCSEGEDGTYNWPGSGTNTDSGGNDGGGNNSGGNNSGGNNSGGNDGNGGNNSGGAGNNVGGTNSCGKDGTANSCKTIVIGGQTWMAENLNRETGFSWCYNNNNSNCNKYGRLYDWPTAMGLEAIYTTTTWGGSDVKRQGVCPAGWHLPSWAEWDTLITYVGGLAVAGGRLKSENGWNQDYYGNDGNGTDNFEFSAIPGGSRSPSGSFSYAGESGIWWMATERSGWDGLYAYYCSMYRGNNSMSRDNTNKNQGFSVRCVQN